MLRVARRYNPPIAPDIPIVVHSGATGIDNPITAATPAIGKVRTPSGSATERSKSDTVTVVLRRNSAATAGTRTQSCARTDAAITPARPNDRPSTNASTTCATPAAIVARPARIRPPNTEVTTVNTWPIVSAITDAASTAFTRGPANRFGPTH